MSKVGRAFLISAVASGLVAAGWVLLSQRRNRPAPSAANEPVSSREDEIEALTQEQKDLMLREMAEHV